MRTRARLLELMLDVAREDQLNWSALVHILGISQPRASQHAIDTGASTFRVRGEEAGRLSLLRLYYISPTARAAPILTCLT